MLEVVALFLLVIAAWYVLPSFLKYFQKSDVVDQSAKLKLPEDSVLRRHFITHLKSEIESALHSCPTDPVLLHRYDSLVAAELQTSAGC